MHQHQREVRTTTDGVEYVEVSAADVAAADRLFDELVGRVLDELPPQTRKVLELVRGFVAERAHASAVAPDDVTFTRRDLREAIGIGDTQLKVHSGTARRAGARRGAPKQPRPAAHVRASARNRSCRRGNRSVPGRPAVGLGARPVIGPS
jgi:hypothetical protein